MRMKDKSTSEEKQGISSKNMALAADAKIKALLAFQHASKISSKMQASKVESMKGKIFQILKASKHLDIKGIKHQSSKGLKSRYVNV